MGVTGPSSIFRSRSNARASYIKPNKQINKSVHEQQSSARVDKLDSWKDETEDSDESVLDMLYVFLLRFYESVKN